MIAESLFRTINPAYRHRYEVYNELISGLIGRETIWVDVGCGVNEAVMLFGASARAAVGVDAVVHSQRENAPFIQANLRRLPLKSECADLVTLRMVAEHLEQVPGDFAEIERILKPGGRMVVLTTNRLSPLVFVPAMLPYRLKQGLITKLLGAAEEDVFPTFHRCNTPGVLRRGILSMTLKSIRFLEQVPLPSAGLSIVFGGWFMVTRLPFLTQLRSTMLAVFEKRS